MSLSLSQTNTAVSPKGFSSFLGVGGTPPYTYAVLGGGAGGTIDSVTGIYNGPADFGSTPQQYFDTVQVTDSAAATATAVILIGPPLILLCDILQQELGLDVGRVYLWDQKILQPKDNDLYIAVSVPHVKVIGNNAPYSTGDSSAISNQYTVVAATVDIDIISRGPTARDRKEEILLAINSVYSQQQQNTNSFYIGRLPIGGSAFMNLSTLDGAAIPYRYRISFMMQYGYTKSTDIDFFANFPWAIYDSRDGVSTVLEAAQTLSSDMTAFENLQTEADENIDTELNDQIVVNTP